MKFNVTKINFGIITFLFMVVFIAGCLYGNTDNAIARNTDNYNNNQFNNNVWYSTNPQFDWGNNFVSNREMSEIMQTFSQKQQEFFSKEFDELKKQNANCGCGINE